MGGIFFNNKFKRIWRRLDPINRSLFNEKLKIFESDLFNFQLNNHLLKGELQGYYSINITGDWRALYFKSGDDIIFSDIGRHTDLYY